MLGRADGASQVQIEFDVTADVAVEEYKDPVIIVVRLKEGEFVGQNVYSLRTLSMDQDALTKMQKDFPDARILHDDGEIIVVRLKEGEFVGQNVYSLRTLSMDQDALTKMQKDFPDARILHDDGESCCWKSASTTASRRHRTR